MKREDIKDSRLKQLRKKKGITQIALQIETGIDQSELSKMERGARIPTLDQAIILARFFETSVDYICGETDVPTPYPKTEK